MSSTSRYLPGTLEKDQKKINQVIQNIGNDTDTNTTNIATNTTNIATNTAAITALQTATTADITNATYTLTDTGAVQSTMINRLTNTLFAHDFGCVGDDSTNDYTNFQKFLTAMQISGKEGRLDANKSYFISGNDLTLAIASGVRNTALYGFGSQIRTDPSQARTGLIIQHATAVTRADETRKVLVDGLRISQFEDGNALAGFSVIGSTFVTLRDCAVLCGSDNVTTPSVNYTAFNFNQSDITDPNTGSFWCEVDTCTVKGATTSTPNGIVVQGQCNAMHIRDCTISNATEGISFQRCNTASSSATAQIANGVRIVGCDFETCTDAIRCLGVSGFTNGADGLMVAECRAETCTTFFNYNNINLNPSDAAYPTFIANYMASSVTTPYNNPNNLAINVLANTLKLGAQSSGGSQIDVSASGGYSITNGSNAAIASPSGYYAFFVGENAAFGGTAIYITLAGAAQPTLVSTSSAVFVAGTTTPAAGKVSVGWDGTSSYRIYNNVGGTAIFRVLAMRIA